MAGFFRNMFSKPALPKGDIVPMSVGMKAKALAARGDHRAALEVYEAFLQSHPQSALALNNAADLCLKLNSPQRACQLLERAIQVDPEYVGAWCNLGEAKRMKRDFLGSVKAFETALKYDSKNTVAKIGFASLCLDIKNAKRACTLLEEVLSVDKKNAVAWHNLGVAKFMYRDLIGAKEAYQMALQLDPHDSQSREGIERVKITESMVIATRQRGATLSGGDGTVFSERHRILVCVKCHGEYTEFGQVNASCRALGGALCRSCGKFYCEPCVSKTLHSDVSPMICICGKSRVRLNNDGRVAMDNFEELVVFRAQ
jgi:tetratricopeptide (TPR) repeat protein